MDWIYFMISSTALIGMVFLIRKWFRKKLSPGAVYALWLFPMIRLIFPFGIAQVPGNDGWAFRLISYPSSVVSEWIEDNETYKMGAENAQKETTKVKIYESVKKEEAGEIRGIIDGKGVWLLVWGIGSTGMLFLTLKRNLQMKTYMDGLEKVGEQNGLPIYAGDHLKSPCLAGFLHPKILLTWEVFADEKQCHYVVLHEVSHFEQKDHVWTAIGILLCIAYWWNPLVWLSVRAAKEDAELSCDARMLRNADLRERKAYGTILLELLENGRNEQMNFGMISFMGDRQMMKRRIEGIIQKNNTRKRYFFPIMLLLIGMLLTGCVTEKSENWLKGSAFDMWWDEENNVYTGCQYNYQVSTRIKSKLLYYEVYEYGTLTDRHIAACGGVESGTDQKIWMSMKNAEDQSLLLVENEGAQIEIPIKNEAYLPGTGTFSWQSANDEVLDVIPEEEIYLGDALQGESVGCKDLKGFNERQIGAETRKIERVLILRMVFSELSEEELFEQYQNKEIFP